MGNTVGDVNAYYTPANTLAICTQNLIKVAYCKAKGSS
jgi:hypothetical protein